MKNINKNIRLELANAGALYNEPKIALVPLWDAFLKQHFKTMDTKAKNWFVARLPKTKSEITTKIKTYTTLAETLKKAKTGKDAVKHAADQKQKQTALDATLVKQKKNVEDAKKKLDDLKKQRAGKTKPADIQKKIKAAKRELQKMEKEVGKTQRKIFELYSSSVEKLVKNLGKDSQRIGNFEKDLAALKFPAL
jgi:DNA repair exonuclease SbcCD ATPase subunit